MANSENSTNNVASAATEGTPPTEQKETATQEDQQTSIPPSRRLVDYKSLKARYSLPDIASEATEQKDAPKKMDPQTSSPLFRLPGELRNQIFQNLFASTRLTFGKVLRSEICMKPAVNSLTILRSCRRIYSEASSLWLERVLFNFEDIITLRDKLSALPLENSSKFAMSDHLQGLPLLGRPTYDDDVSVRLPSFLKLLPALSLNTLTLLNGDLVWWDYT